MRRACAAPRALGDQRRAEKFELPQADHATVLVRELGEGRHQASVFGFVGRMRRPACARGRDLTLAQTYMRPVGALAPRRAGCEMLALGKRK